MTDSLSVQRFEDPDAASQLASAPAPRRALFLDRDGVINVDHGYVHDAAQTDFIDGIFDLVRQARALGYLPIVVTNQAGIARGLYDEAQFLSYTRWLHARFSQEGAPLFATFWCPHHPDAGLGALRRECDCRKPRPGMLLAARDAYAIDLQASLLLGDSDKDLKAAHAAGVGMALRLDPDATGNETIRRPDEAKAWLRTP